MTKVFVHRRIDNLLTQAPDRSRLLRRLERQEPQSLKDGGPIKLDGGESPPVMKVGTGLAPQTGPPGTPDSAAIGLPLGAVDAAEERSGLTRSSTRWPTRRPDSPAGAANLTSGRALSGLRPRPWTLKRAGRGENAPSGPGPRRAVPIPITRSTPGSMYGSKACQPLRR